jgi:hypothetical protein
VKAAQRVAAQHLPCRDGGSREQLGGGVGKGVQGVALRDRSVEVSLLVPDDGRVRLIRAPHFGSSWSRIACPFFG